MIFQNFFISGENIEAKSHDDVTMLFSDIVGFTSICATATPMMVIAMLEDLYSVFDVFCGELDVYKVKCFRHIKYIISFTETAFKKR